jgi:hypothetical protein
MPHAFFQDDHGIEEILAIDAVQLLFGLAQAVRKRRLIGPGGTLGDARVLGITPEGTRILKPRGRPTSFSVSKLKRAIAAATNES